MEKEWKVVVDDDYMTGVFIERPRGVLTKEESRLSTSIIRSENGMRHAVSLIQSI